MSPVVIVILLAIKNQLFDEMGKIWRPICQQLEVWYCEKIIFVQQLNVLYSDELKNAYYTNTNKFYLYFKSSKKMIFLDFWQNQMKLKMAVIWEPDCQLSSKFVIYHISLVPCIPPSLREIYEVMYHSLPESYRKWLGQSLQQSSQTGCFQLIFQRHNN